MNAAPPEQPGTEHLAEIAPEIFKIVGQAANSIDFNWLSLILSLAQLLMAMLVALYLLRRWQEKKEKKKKMPSTEK